jgi:NADH:ubiquinone oxidoreductase subunit 6 (subunit J)
MEASTVFFYLFGILILFAAVKTVSSSNLVHSALYMVAAFVGVACIFLLLNADYIALVQILVYVGAISVLMVFGVMLTRRGDIKESNPFNTLKIAGGLVSIALFLVVARLLILTGWGASTPAPMLSTVDQITDLLLKDYAIPFEAAGILLLVAMIGAIIIGRGVDNRK